MSDVTPCVRDGCTNDWGMACLCGPVCFEHAFAHMNDGTPCRALLVRAFAVYFRELVMRARQVEEEIAPARMHFVESTGAVYDCYYPGILSAYEDAGSPLGDDELAPLRWLEAQADDEVVH